MNIGKEVENGTIGLCSDCAWWEQHSMTTVSGTDRSAREKATLSVDSRRKINYSLLNWGERMWLASFPCFLSNHVFNLATSNDVIIS